MAEPQDIRERAFEFAVSVIKLTKALPRTTDAQVLGRQVLRSATSVGANLEEAQAGYTRPDFAYRNTIALKEARETHYWLRLLLAAGLVNADAIQPLIKEADEITRILGAIVTKARRNK